MDGPPIHGNTRLEIIWTAIPAIMLVALCSYAYVVLTDIEEAAGRRARTSASSASSSPGPSTTRTPAGKEVASPQLYVPRGQPVNFTVQSKDVIHDFWVPAFRMKIDAVPGHRHAAPRHAEDRSASTRSSARSCAASATPSCARPRTSSSQAEFDSWLRGARRGGAEGGGAAAGGGETGGGARRRRDGKAVFTAAGCGGCHALADAGTSGGTGPDLDEALAGQGRGVHRGEHRRPERRDRARASRTGIMPPNYGDTLQPAELDALVKYLAEVTK